MAERCEARTETDSTEPEGRLEALSTKVDAHATMFQRRIDEIVDRLYALESTPTGSVTRTEGSK